MEHQGVHGGVRDGNKVMGHVGMCEDTTSERELRKTGMSSLSHASPCPHNRFATTCRAQPAGLVTVSTLARCNFARRPWRSLDMVALMAFIILRDYVGIASGLCRGYVGAMSGFGLPYVGSKSKPRRRDMPQKGPPRPSLAN